jgi:hypothetical protein
MATNRHEHHPSCRLDRSDPYCAALAVRGLSQERAYELAEEIWTASGTGRRTWRWRVWLVIGVALGSGLLVGLAAGAGLGWRMAVVAAWAVGGADLLHGRHGEAPNGWGS